MALVTTAVVAPGVSEFFVRTMLKVGRPYLVHSIPSTKIPFESRTGLIIKLRRHDDLADALTPFLEGVTPAEANPTYADITATLHQYGNWMKFSDIADLVSVENLRAIYAEKLGANMAKTADSINRDLQVGGTQVRYANNVVNRAAVVTSIATGDLQAIDRVLLGNNAEYFTSMTKGDAKFDTTPIRPAYFVIGHTDCKRNIEGLTGYDSVERYSSQTQVYDSEIGRWGNFRFILTSNAKIYPDLGGAPGALKSTTGAACDVYPLLIFAKDAYAEIALEEGNVSNITQEFGSAGTEDPLNQEMSIGWKFLKTGAIISDPNLYRYEIGVTA